MYNCNLSQDLVKELFHYEPNIGILSHRTSSRTTNGKPVGTLNPGGYRRVCINKTSYAVHRLAWLYVYGQFPPDQLDHINGIRHDNRIKNLRAVTRQENQRNRVMSKNNTSGFIGVTWVKSELKWLAQVKVDGKSICLGRYLDKRDAINARKEANVKYGFHQGHGKCLEEKP